MWTFAWPVLPNPTRGRRSRPRGRWHQAVRLIITAAHLAFLATVLFFGVQLVQRVQFQTFASMELSMSWAYAALPVGALLALVAVIAHHLDPRSQELEMAQ